MQKADMLQAGGDNLESPSEVLSPQHPQVVGPWATGNQKQVALKEAKHQVNQKFNRNEKYYSTVGWQWLF